MAYEFAVNLSDQVTPGAKSSGDAVAELSAKMRLAQMDIAGMPKAMKSAQTGMQAFATGVVRVGETMKMAVSQISGFAGSLASGDFAGAITKVTTAVAGAAKMLDMALPGLGTAIATVIPIIGGLIGGMVGLAEKFFSFSIASAEGKERTIAFYGALADGHATGEQVAGMIGKIADKIGWTSSKLKPFAKDLMAMGHRDLPDLRQELVAVASAQALMGEGAGEAYVGLSRQIEVAVESGNKFTGTSKKLGKSLADIGLSIGDVADKMGISGKKLAESLKAGHVEADKLGEAIRDTMISKGKGPLDAMSHSLDAIGNRLHNTIEKVFKGANVKPFLQALENVVDAIGQILGKVGPMGSTIDGVFKWAGGAVEDMAIMLIDAGFWAKHAGEDIYDFFAETGAGSAIIDTVIDSFRALGAIVQTVIDGVKMLAKTLEIVDFSPQNNAKTQIDKLIKEKKAARAPEIVESTEVVTSGLESGAEIVAAERAGVETGKALSEGVAKGIAAGTIGVVAEAKKMGAAGAGGLRTELKVKSPSRVMVDIGENVAEGFAIGMRGGIPDVEGAARDLSRITIEPAANSNSRDGGGAPSRSIGPITVYITIDGAGKDAQEITEEAVATVFERIALAQGVG